MNLRTLSEDPATLAILEERAQALALVDADADAEVGEEMLTFRLGDNCYALPVRYVREVRNFDTVTPLPSVPEWILGLINVRGRLLTALDIRPLLETASVPPQPGSTIVIVGAGDIELGLIADLVIEVRRHLAEPQPTPSTAGGRGVAWVRGVDEALNLLIDLPVLLADPRLIINDEVE